MYIYMPCDFYTLDNYLCFNKLLSDVYVSFTTHNLKYCIYLLLFVLWNVRYHTKIMVVENNYMSENHHQPKCKSEYISHY